MKENSPKIKRSEFIVKIGIAFLSTIVACKRKEVISPTPTAFQAITKTPQPTLILPTSTPISDTSKQLTEKKVCFLAAHEVMEGDTSRPVVMMTYDDNAKYTDVRTILDALRMYNAKATFFFIGEKITASAKAVRAIVEEGHTLGCHGYNHIDLLGLSDSQINRQIENSFKAIDEVVPGYQMHFIRFPYGSGMGDTRLLSIAASWGLQHVYWTMGSGGLDTKTYDNVMQNIQNGSIILSHMFRPYDVLYAEKIICSLVESGYSLEAVDTGRKPEDIFR